MLGRTFGKASKSSSTFHSAGQAHNSSFPFNPPLEQEGRRLDITFSQLFLQPARQPTIMATISRIKHKKNIEKAAYRLLPNVEKRRLYLESRPLRQKLLDWVGSKTTALVRSAGTVDAWSGPTPKNVRQSQVTGSDVKLLQSGHVAGLRAGISDRAKKTLTYGMILSMGGLTGWLLFGLSQRTKAEGLVEEPTPESFPKKAKATPVIEEKEKRPGVFVWGSNRGDVTAPGSKDDFVKTATRLSYFDGRALRDLALSNDLGVAVDENGDVIQWGRAFSHTLEPEPTLKGKNITNVAISGDNAICLSKSGKVYVLPASKADLLSGPKPSEWSWFPFWSSTTDVSCTPLSIPEKISQIAAGDDHFILLSRSGKVYSAASTTDGNTFSQLGIDIPPDSVPLLEPFQVPTPDNETAISIAAGERHSLFLTSHGNVYSWGSNAQGQLLQQFAKNNYVVPTPTLVPLHHLIPGIAEVHSIAAGGANSFLVISREGDVEVYASGSGMWGQLGNGVWNQIQHKPVRVKTIQGLVEWNEHLRRRVNIGVKYLSVGENHVAAVLDNDVSGGIGGRDVYMWGCGEAYQLGHGKRNNVNIPSTYNPLVNVEGRLADFDPERFMLQPRRKIAIRTADGRIRHVFCEESIVLGGGCSAVYEKIVP